MTGASAPRPGMGTAARDRLVKVLGRLGSEHQGERAVAAAMADKLVRESGMDWATISDAFRSRPAVHPSSLRPARFPVGTHDRVALYLQSFPELLTAWEASFVRSIRSAKRLTDRQRDTLGNIKRRVDLAREGRSI